MRVAYERMEPYRMREAKRRREGKALKGGKRKIQKFREPLS